MTDFDKFYERFARAVNEDEVFASEADEFFHSYYFHILFADTHDALEEIVDFFEEAREPFRVSDPDAYVRALVKFGNEFHEYAIDQGIVEPDNSLPDIDDVLEKTITLKAWRLELHRDATEQAEAAA